MPPQDFDPTVCNNTLTAGGFVPVCPASHCTDFQETSIYHANCNGARMYSPVQSLGCYNATANPQWQFWAPEEVLDKCEELREKDKNWKAKNCYCCCSCFARDTPVAVPNGEVPMWTIDVGQEILAAAEGGDGLVWEAKQVKFSQGSVGGTEPAMVYLVCGADNRSIIASPDQPFMLADGTLLVAKQLAPGMALMDRDGQPVPIKTASIGEYTGGIHHIATSTSYDGNIDGHLILAGGVVAGDFVLQLHFQSVPPARKRPGHDQLPAIGTPEYARHHGKIFQVGKTLTYAVAHDVGEIESEAFRSYQARTEIPFGARSWVTPDQANDILSNGHQRPLHDRSGYASAVNAVALLKGFFPDYDYYIDWAMNEPNVYVFEQYGRAFVVLSGGLVRMDGLFYEGITMAVAQGVARWKGGDPEDSGGFSCVGEADLYAFGVISQQIWFGNAWLDQAVAAYEQIGALFALISPVHAGGNPLDRCGDPSIACRKKTMQSGLGGGSLPECAGGPAPTLLGLETADGTTTSVTLVFNLGVTAATADNPDNYQLLPSGKVTAATRDPAKDFVVTLTTELEPGTYRVQCANLVSVYGSTLDPAASGLNFTVAAAPADPKKGK